MKVSDEVSVNEKYVSDFIDILDDNNVSYVQGKVWTTDAPYRETRAKVLKRKEQGCICVDMECSAMAAVAKFRGVNFGQFFYAADNLGEEEYDARSLIVRELNDSKKKIIPLALECAIELDKKL